MLYRKVIKKYDLKFSVEKKEVHKILKDLKNIYNLSSIDEAFFYFIKNEIGSELMEMGEEYEDALAWLRIDKKPNSGWFLFVFEETDDYVNYKYLRNHIYFNIKNKRLLNWLELNCVDFVLESNAIKSLEMQHYYLAETEYVQIYFVTNHKTVRMLDIKYIELETLDFNSLYSYLVSSAYTVTYLGDSDLKDKK